MCFKEIHSLQEISYFLHQDYHAHVFLMYLWCPIYSICHLTWFFIEFSYASTLRPVPIIKNEAELSRRGTEDLVSFYQCDRGSKKSFRISGLVSSGALWEWCIQFHTNRRETSVKYEPFTRCKTGWLILLGVELWGADQKENWQQVGIGWKYSDTLGG